MKLSNYIYGTKVFKNLPCKNHNFFKMFQIIQIEKNHFVNENHQNSEINDKKLKNSLKDCVRSWCENTSSHGFYNMLESKFLINKIIWMILVLVGIGYCVLSNIFSLSFILYTRSVQ